VVVSDQDFGDAEGVGGVTLANQVQGADDRRPPLPGIVRASEPVEDIPRSVSEIAADNLRSRDIEQIPVVDPIAASQVKAKQLLAALLARPLAPRLLVHDAEGAGPYLVDRALEQLLDLGRRHVDELLGEREHLAHAHAGELVALAAFQRALVGRRLLGLGELLQTPEELIRRDAFGHLAPRRTANAEMDSGLSPGTRPCDRWSDPGPPASPSGRAAC
jgi:hypothetical protein